MESEEAKHRIKCGIKAGDPVGVTFWNTERKSLVWAIFKKMPTSGEWLGLLRNHQLAPEDKLRVVEASLKKRTVETQFTEDMSAPGLVDHAASLAAKATNLKETDLTEFERNFLKAAGLRKQIGINLLALQYGLSISKTQNLITVLSTGGLLEALGSSNKRRFIPEKDRLPLAERLLAAHEAKPLPRHAPLVYVLYAAHGIPTSSIARVIGFDISPSRISQIIKETRQRIPDA